jgi:hypothetical protein
MEFPIYQVDQFKDDPGDMKRYAAQQANAVVKFNCRLETSNSNLFNALLAQCTTSLVDKIKEAKNWEEIMNSRDPLLLWRRIKIIMVSGTNTLSVNNIIATESRFIYLKQLKQQALSDFRHEFLERICALKAAGGKEWEEPILAAYFLSKLDPERFSTMVADLTNALRGVVDYPSTVLQAYDIACNCVKPNNGVAQQGTIDILIPTAFMTTTADESDADETPDNKGKLQDNKKGDKREKEVCRNFAKFGNCKFADKCRFEHPTPGGKSKGNKKEATRPCKVCEEMHLDSDCLIVEDAKKLVTQRKSSTTAMLTADYDV